MTDKTMRLEAALRSSQIVLDLIRECKRLATIVERNRLRINALEQRLHIAPRGM